ncbi:MAG: imidazolonepropionase [Acidimicrobiales bacterium]|nr:imidazolonepropionase [Acidimicrobiales bacterium]
MSHEPAHHHGGDEAAGPTTIVVDNIGLLVTNDPALGEGPLGLARDAALVIEDGRVHAIERCGVAADDAFDAAGRCVIPGFVDSHTHLVFAGDRADEFVARLTGQPYDPAGIATTVAATRATTDDELLRLARRRQREAWAGGTTHLEVKSGYGLDVTHEHRSLQVASRLTDDTTFLGAHLVPPEYRDRADDYVDLVCGAMLDRCAPLARWIDVFCERGAFDRDQARAILDAGRRAGLGGRVHANQLGPGPGVQVAVEAGAASADHCTYLSAADLDALAGSDTVATFLPAADFSTRQPYPDGRAAVDAGVAIALASNCNPGSSNTTSMAFVIALAVREMGLTIDEALLASTLGGARALRRADRGHLGIGARADAVVLDAPSFTHLAYRPGMPLVAATLIDGQPVTPDDIGRLR